jgi:hypothetical protein
MSSSLDGEDVVVDLSEYNGNQLVLTAAIFLAIAALSVGLRAYVRVVLTQSFRADDWLLLAGIVVFVFSCTFILAGTQFGVGRHNAALEQRDEIEALKVCVGCVYMPPLQTGRAMGEIGSISLTDLLDTVASTGDRELHPGHDAHQAQHRHLLAAALDWPRLQVDHQRQPVCRLCLEHGELSVGHFPVQPRRGTVGLHHCRGQVRVLSGGCQGCLCAQRARHCQRLAICERASPSGACLWGEN